MSDDLDNGKPIKKPKRALPERYASYHGVWVYVEQEHGAAHPVSWELLEQGRQLAASLGVELAAVVLGDAVADICVAQAFHYGADKVYRIADPVLHHYRNQPYTHGLTELVSAFQPEILLLGATPQGRDLAGSVATTLRTGLTADCTGLEIDPADRSLLSSRPTFGGSLMCTIVNLATRPQMATVRPRVMPMPTPDASRSGSGEIVTHPLGMSEDAIITKVRDFIPDAKQDKPQLAFADFIVAGGRGMQKADNFQLLFDLAQVLGAEVGASRPAVHAGWVELDRQVGQSGKTVRPKLYLAAGISGAVQHRVGMQGADVIVAINNDPNAPICQFADYVLNGNALELLPELTRAFRERLAKSGGQP